MIDRNWNDERRAQRVADRWSFWIILAVMLGFAVVHSLSAITESAWRSEVLPPAASWVSAFSSFAAMAVLVPFIQRAASHAPVSLDTWRWTIPAHFIVSLAVCAAHVTGMVLIRKAFGPLLFNDPYTFFGPETGELLYEYRKDALTYAGFLFIIQSSRDVEQHRLEAQAAREDARREKRLTLKCGGRTIWIEARDLIAAKAAGNYVEVRTETGRHLARTTLAALESQLEEAGVRAARVHRSYLVNLDKILEAAPTGSGDLVIRLTDGESVPASRRFRGKLDAA